MPGISTAIDLAIEELIRKQTKRQQKILFKLWILQQNYKYSLFWWRKKAKQEIDKIYPQYPKEVKILKRICKQVLSSAGF
jgi:hypothetical protein